MKKEKIKIKRKRRKRKKKEKTIRKRKKKKKQKKKKRKTIQKETKTKKKDTKKKRKKKKKKKERRNRKKNNKHKRKKLEIVKGLPLRVKTLWIVEDLAPKNMYQSKTRQIFKIQVFWFSHVWSKSPLSPPSLSHSPLPLLPPPPRMLDFSVFSTFLRSIQK